MESIMTFPNFHDGHFDGLWMAPDKIVCLFLRTYDGALYTIILKRVQAMAVSDVWASNIIFDLVFRGARELTPSDLGALYHMDETPARLTELLNEMRGKDLQILQLNASYGAQGLFLFENSEITEKHHMLTSLPSAE